MRPGWWKGYQGLLAAFAVDEQDAGAVFFAQIGDIGAAGFGDAQPEKTKHRD